MAPVCVKALDGVEIFVVCQEVEVMLDLFMQRKVSAAESDIRSLSGQQLGIVVNAALEIAFGAAEGHAFIGQFFQCFERILRIVDHSGGIRPLSVLVGRAKRRIFKFRLDLQTVLSCDRMHRPIVFLKSQRNDVAVIVDIDNGAVVISDQSLLTFGQITRVCFRRVGQRIASVEVETLFIRTVRRCNVRYRGRCFVCHHFRLSACSDDMVRIGIAAVACVFKPVDHFIGRSAVRLPFCFQRYVLCEKKLTVSDAAALKADISHQRAAAVCDFCIIISIPALKDIAFHLADIQVSDDRLLCNELRGNIFSAAACFGGIEIQPVSVNINRIQIKGVVIINGVIFAAEADRSFAKQSARYVCQHFLTLCAAFIIKRYRLNASVFVII